MIIYRMTATFGKLEHETLTLEPGMNVLQADNEWGKSTWCAFLVAMLYGLDTRAKSTKTSLAEKDRYAPWSGSPMSGSMDICWNGRDITIQRSTKGRIPMGEFRAFETQTGMVVPELTATNCGQMLLGVEQSVFRRAGFVRFSDLTVTSDDALRRRLNALVTTGDESGDGEKLERSLRELKNKCRYNRTGLIPQAEQELSVVEKKLEEWTALEKQVQKLQTRLAEVERWVKQLENHRNALQFAAAQDDAQRISQAQETCEAAQTRLTELEALCSKLPAQDQAERRIRQLREYQQQWHDLQMELAMLPAKPEKPEAPEAFVNMELSQAKEMVAEDTQAYRRMRSQKPGILPFMGAVFCVIAAVYFGMCARYSYLAVASIIAVLLFGLGIHLVRRRKNAMSVLEEKYGSNEPEQWRSDQENYTGAWQNYNLQMTEYRLACGDLDVRQEALKTRQQSLCGAQSPEKVLQLWQQVLHRWEAYHNARREVQRAQSHLEDLQAMAKKSCRPSMEDTLSYTEGETARLISDALAEQQRLQNRLGQHQGQMEALGSRSVLENQLAAVSRRLEKLEKTYDALELALETLTQAKRELQRRFAPRISKRAQELMETMTDGRYTRFAMGEDFGLSAGAGEEDVLHTALWRSDGTVDQLYLALRLAVAEELTPEAPLVLDDALVRFDDKRLKAALKILKQMSQKKQVILFTCHGREKTLE